MMQSPAPVQPIPENEETARLKRIDDNLRIMRDKIEEAERLPGVTRSELLSKLGGNEDVNNREALIFSRLPRPLIRN